MGQPSLGAAQEEANVNRAIDKNKANTVFFIFSLLQNAKLVILVCSPS